MNIKHIVPVLCASALALFLSGCGNEKQPPAVKYSFVSAYNVPADSVDKDAQAQIAESAARVSESLQELSAINMATHPHFRMPTPRNAKAIGMSQSASVSWNGPIGPIIKRIAKASHYKVHVFGKAPATPIMIVLDKQNETLASILRDVIFQANNNATVKVFPATKTLELRYIEPSFGWDSGSKKKS